MDVSHMQTWRSSQLVPLIHGVPIFWRLSPLWRSDENVSFENFTLIHIQHEVGVLEECCYPHNLFLRSSDSGLSESLTWRILELKEWNSTGFTYWKSDLLKKNALINFGEIPYTNQYYGGPTAILVNFREIPCPVRVFILINRQAPLWSFTPSTQEFSRSDTQKGSGLFPWYSLFTVVYVCGCYLLRDLNIKIFSKMNVMILIWFLRSFMHILLYSIFWVVGLNCHFF